jgi:hypothetical protein
MGKRGRTRNSIAGVTATEKRGMRDIAGYDPNQHWNSETLPARAVRGCLCALFARTRILNRHTATSSMFQRFPIHQQPAQAVVCCALKREGKPHNIGIVALCRGRTAQSRQPDAMPLSSEILTRSRFERRLLGGRLDLVFKVAFSGDAAAARVLRVSKMTVWRWRHGRSPLPKLVADALVGIIQYKVEQAHEAKQQLRDFCALPPRPPRPLSGCCAGYFRNQKTGPFDVPMI